jgi:hydroxymethylbilane synthase
MNRPVIIGTRGSELALWQANFVKARLESFHPGEIFGIEVINTTGDKVSDVALSKIGDKGLFTREIGDRLLDRTIDLAVHSLKDLQTSQPDGISIGAVCERAVANDVLISRTAQGFRDLPEGALIATGSLRRRSQLLATRPDLQIVDVRGNVPTRLRKFDESDWDGMILAHAGLERLGLRERIAESISAEVMIPAVGQGAVAVEIRDAPDEIAAMIAKLDHQETRICITAERAFLRRLEGGCQVPIGGHATLTKASELLLNGYVGSLDGTIAYRKTIKGPTEAADELGGRLADELLTLGAGELLDLSRAESQAGRSA